MTIRSELDLTQKLSRKDYEQLLTDRSRRIDQLRLALGGKLGDGKIGPGLLICIEGWDAAGKGGAIRRLIAPLDARHVRVVQFAAPTPDEKRHFYLQRFSEWLPGLGGMAVFDRTWYGRVLVERVEGFATTEQWQRAYSEIVDYERSLSLEGLIIVKLWLEISPEMQLKRFKQREADPLKAWKLTDEDWRNREQRPAYEQAITEMLDRTDTSYAPWTVVEADDKLYARVKVLETVNAAIERGLLNAGIKIADPE